MSNNATRKAKPYTPADMRAVSENPKWTKQDVAKAKRFGEAFPDLARTVKRVAPMKRSEIREK